MPALPPSPVDRESRAGRAHASGRIQPEVAKRVVSVRNLVVPLATHSQPKQVLRGEGYEVLLAADGEEAIALADRTRVDVLLTDLAMPGIGGHELADRLRTKAPEMKVMFMSGFAEGADFSASALPPATAFLEKPFTFAMLSERIRELIAI